MDILTLAKIPIQTDRLVLRKFQKRDVDAARHKWGTMAKIHGIQMKTTRNPQTVIREVLTQWQNEFRLAIVLRETGEMVGNIGFCRYYAAEEIAELDYYICDAYAGNDYAAEALRRLIHFLFMETELDVLEILCTKTDERSWKVVQKAGMYQVKTLKRFAFEQPQPDGVFYAVSRQRYLDIY